LTRRALPDEGNALDTYNGGVNCHSSKDGRPKQMFIGWMAYTRSGSIMTVMPSPSAAAR
jgi:hypothetical protein